MSVSPEELYQILLEAGLSEQEIDRQIKSKQAEYQGFMSPQAILFLIAKEYAVDLHKGGPTSVNYSQFEEEIDYNDFAIPIEKVKEGMQNIVIVGRLITQFGIRNFIRKDGTLGMVASFVVADSTAQIRIILWGDNTDIINHPHFKKGEVIQIIGGYTKPGTNNSLEIHLSKKGKVVIAPEGIKVESLGEKVFVKKQESTHAKTTIKFLQEKEGFIRSISGVVHIEEFKEFIKKNGERAFLLRLALTDETTSIMVNVWGMEAVEYLKQIEDGSKITLFNVVIKFNQFSGKKEISQTKATRLKISHP
ncbi:MAG: hypothetical protein ACXAES_11265 [Promethearchaeota archaeon]|jgi:ssDNA-binding replication factor A large subunit